MIGLHHDEATSIMFVSLGTEQNIRSVINSSIGQNNVSINFGTCPRSIRLSHELADLNRYGRICGAFELVARNENLVLGWNVHTRFVGKGVVGLDGKLQLRRGSKYVLETTIVHGKVRSNPITWSALEANCAFFRRYVLLINLEWYFRLSVVQPYSTICVLAHFQ